MYCNQCGKRIAKTSKFCPHCGEPIDPSLTSSDEQTEKEDTYCKKVKENKKRTLSDILKEKFLIYWHKIDLFCKIETVAIPIAVLLLVISLFSQYIFPIVFSVLQLCGLIAALLMHKNVITLDKKWIKYIVLSVTVLFTVVNISSYSWFATIKVPYGASECIGKDKETVRKAFLSADYTKIQLIALEDLDMTESKKNGLVVSVTVNGSSKFDSNDEFGKSAKVVVKYHSYKCIGTPVSSEEVKTLDIESIENIFRDAGFENISFRERYDLDPGAMKSEYEIGVLAGETGEFKKGDKFSLDTEIIIVTHRAREEYKLELDIDFTKNLILNKYKVIVEIGEHAETLNHGKDGHFEYVLERGTYKITFRKKGSKSIKKTVEIDLTGDTKAAYRISCHDDKISVTKLYIESPSKVGEGEAMIPISASDCEYENYKKIEKKFKDAGLTNIKTKILYDIVWGFTDEGEVEKVSVDGKTNFIRGDVFATDAEIVITYHMKEEDDPNKKDETTSDSPTIDAPSPVFYSTNDYKTAQKGNTGVFSYKSKGGTYDVYWIIDFDDGYVYYFTEGNGEDFCDKVKITSGTLNDRVTITWNFDGETTEWYLHFKYVNQPVTLIVNDHFGSAIEFTTADLNKALSIRSSKIIYNR